MNDKDKGKFSRYQIGKTYKGSFNSILIQDVTFTVVDFDVRYLYPSESGKMYIVLYMTSNGRTGSFEIGSDFDKTVKEI